MEVTEIIHKGFDYSTLFDTILPLVDDFKLTYEQALMIDSTQKMLDEETLKIEEKMKEFHAKEGHPKKW